MGGKWRASCEESVPDWHKHLVSLVEQSTAPSLNGTHNANTPVGCVRHARRSVDNRHEVRTGPALPP